MDLTLSPQLLEADIASHYQQDLRVRLENVLPAEQAAEVFTHLSSQTKYDMAVFHDSRPQNYTADDLQAMGQENIQQLQQQVNQNASQGIGYVYGRNKIDQHGISSPLTDVIKWLNSEEVLNWARKLSGHYDIIAASAQATRYVSGNFLTRHNDINDQEQRRVAYVLSFNQEWHPDWGGLLQFYENNGTPRDAWPPGFNTLSLFDVRHVHSVTYVTPFAAQPRFSITGWFRATPI